MAYQLQLEGVSCNSCVNKIRRQIQQLDSDGDIQVDLETLQAQVNSRLALTEVIDTIAQLGYPASELQSKTSNRILLQLEGVSCNGCVNKIRQQIQQRDSDGDIQVDLDSLQAEVSSKLAEAEVLELIRALGYPAQVLEPSELTPLASCDSAGQDKLVPTTSVESPSAIPSPSIPIEAPASLTASVRDGSEPSIQLALSGLTCAACVSSVQKALDAVPGVDRAEINFANRTAQVMGSVTDAALIDAVIEAGYGAEAIQDPEQLERQQQQQRQQEMKEKRRNSLLALGLGLPMMAWGMAFGMAVETPTQQLGWGLVGLLTLLVMGFCGGHFFTGAWKTLRNRGANMDSLIALGTGSAWLYSMLVVLWPELLPAQSRGLYFEASALIIGLVNLGQVLELRARGQTQQAIRGLLDLQPKRARVLRDGIEQELAVELVQPGDLIRLRTGETVAVDGEVEQGDALLDESMLTGEPLPVAKTAGDAVAAGTMNTQGALLYRATRVGRDTVLAGIISMVQQAQNSKPPISRMADRVASVFVPVVILIALASAMLWWLLGPEPKAVYMLVSSVTVLIIACPCALGLATPISTMIGIGKAAELGVLIRNGDALQRASEITTLVLDKTGTLTQGRPDVVELELAESAESRQVLNLIHGLEKNSQHPLAAALNRYCDSQGVEPLDVQGFETLDGLGVRARTEAGESVLLGNRRLMQQQGIDLSPMAGVEQRWQQQAWTQVYLAYQGQLLAMVAITDPLREDAAPALQRLHRQGVKLVMLTGDNSASAEAVSQQLGIDEFQAELLPQHKLDYVAQLQQRGEVVAMVGDGINDAPALSLADVSFAIGSGTDVAIESADVALMHDSLDGLADAVELSRATLTNIRQNLWGAFIYNSIGIPIAAGLLFPLTGMLLNPVVAGLAMSLSSVTVVTNANRLRLFRVQRS
ncbi:heavy metal translocating P-type ATPase [Motiliproteus coralliicola]|uniref:Copper-exporting P-type ATPase n=1 Tax=Motiliproteus coralliicola TaxID=2283196 RepID=A0A369WQJ7_9GAMM|nr:heavy metal translocating P-type ATPase [Motiliproteus coralliicola]RDE22836.1 heavy metal translocating P-type ATPase [Motiliproteus coralliicola]